MRGSHRERCNGICRCRRRSFRTAVIVVMLFPLGHDENRSRIVGCYCRESRHYAPEFNHSWRLNSRDATAMPAPVGDDHRHAAPRAVSESGPLRQRHARCCYLSLKMTAFCQAVSRFLHLGVIQLPTGHSRSSKSWCAEKLLVSTGPISRCRFHALQANLEATHRYEVCPQQAGRRAVSPEHFLHARRQL